MVEKRRCQSAPSKNPVALVPCVLKVFVRVAVVPPVPNVGLRNFAMMGPASLAVPTMTTAIPILFATRKRPCVSNPLVWILILTVPFRNSATMPLVNV